jgi:hypothetical protein
MTKPEMRIAKSLVFALRLALFVVSIPASTRLTVAQTTVPKAQVDQTHSNEGCSSELQDACDLLKGRGKDGLRIGSHSGTGGGTNFDYYRKDPFSK